MYNKISCVYSSSQISKEYYEIIKSQVATLYSPQESDVIVVLGGDGFLLRCMHKYINLNKPIYGINCGSVGFMLNLPNLSKHNILDLINTAKITKLYPLNSTIYDVNQVQYSCIAFNEVSLLRYTHYAVHLKVLINNKIELENLVGDGILISTPSGSTSYNRACGGPIIGLTSNKLIVNAINAFSPINWQFKVISNVSVLDIEVINWQYRKLNLFCDFKEFKDIYKVQISLSNKSSVSLLFDINNNLENKILQTETKKYISV